jgi:hypothetical protein
MKKTGILVLGLTGAVAVFQLGCGRCGGESGKPASQAAAPPPAAAVQPAAPHEEDVQTQTDQGEPEKAEIAEGQLPKDYPSDLPIYPGAKPTTSMLVGGSGLVVLNSDASVADILAHYREDLPAKGWTVDNVSESPARIEAHKGTRTASISISQSGSGTEIGLALTGS